MQLKPASLILLKSDFQWRFGGTREQEASPPWIWRSEQLCGQTYCARDMSRFLAACRPVCRIGRRDTRRYISPPVFYSASMHFSQDLVSFLLSGLRVARIVRSLVQALLDHDSFDLWFTTFDVAVSGGHDSSGDLPA